jgi:hypothetical protein
MSERERETSETGKDIEGEPGKGPNLTLLYGLLVLALAAAIGFALLIVLPFYRRR